MPRRSPILAALAVSVAVICGGIPAMPARAGDAADTMLSSARLIAAPTARDGVWTIGVAIILKGKAHTYWRNPGDAGVPPVFDFAASTNVAKTAVAYPVPKHIGEADLDTIGYESEVIFPVRVGLADPAAPAKVVVQVDYATCERICLPARANLTLALPPALADVDVKRLADAEARVPRLIDLAAARALADIAPETQGGVAGWRIRPKAADASDLFVEAPEGFFLSTKRDGEAFRVSVVEHPPGQPSPEWIRITLASATGAVEFSLPSGQ